MNYTAMFHHLFPGYFEKDYIRCLPPEDVFDEQVLDLSAWKAEEVQTECPAHITFGLYDGDWETLRAAVHEVEEEWVQYFKPGDRIFCAFDGERVVSFCNLDEFSEYEGLKIGGPGCVGTIPAYRRQGIGLRMVQKATACLKEAGCDLSWIHYTHVGHWYARLGYRTVVRWNALGVVEE
jgi:GNAT superfamily N-acetyltransferase